MAAVHPDRFNATTTTRKLGVVVHTSESGDGSYEALRRYVEMPGDRQTSSGGMYGSAYHALTRNDPDATYDELLGDDAAPFSAPPVNATWLHICIPGRASQSRAEWLDPASRSGIRATAKYIVAKARRHGFPLERRTPDELRALMGGYCGHIDVSWAWRKSTHTDPGSFFPWDVLAADISALTAPKPAPVPVDPEEDDMALPAFEAIYEPIDALIAAGQNKVFGQRHDGGVEHLSGPQLAYARYAGAKTFPIEGDEHYRQLAAKATR